MRKKDIKEMNSRLKAAMKENSQLTNSEKQDLLEEAESMLGKTKRTQKSIDIISMVSEKMMLYLTVPVGVVFSFWGGLFLFQNNKSVILLNDNKASYLGILGMGIGVFLLGISYFLDLNSLIRATDAFITFTSIVAFAISFVGISFMWLSPTLWISLIIYSIVICLIQFIKAGIAALHKSVKDPKDRLTIIVAIIGSLIALIALFK
ncbi:hypothetical protein ACFP1L_10715 [Lactiplantibacillus nangangensis]|uniref:Uncharacterized protein n=1 Tax=Lactiplantibacillus nangangensis TaxID=2559917 RepID=A0ABW1SLY1_9LACO|nr:hypothetical protein [Lactiplantibacillus nangangensis]